MHNIGLYSVLHIGGINAKVNGIIRDCGSNLYVGMRVVEMF